MKPDLDESTPAGLAAARMGLTVAVAPLLLLAKFLALVLSIVGGISLINAALCALLMIVVLFIPNQAHLFREAAFGMCSSSLTGVLLMWPRRWMQGRGL